MFFVHVDDGHYFIDLDDELRDGLDPDWTSPLFTEVAAAIQWCQERNNALA